MSNLDHDYSDYQEAEISGDKMEQLSKYAEELSLANLAVAQAEDALESAQKNKKRITDKLILPIMDELKIEEFKTNYGFTIKVQEEIRASIPKDREQEAFAWLRETGNESLIKNELKLSFGRNEDNMVKSLAAEFEERGLAYEQKTSVHASTLAAFVREKLTKGAEVPMELLGVMRQRLCRLDDGTKKRTKK